MRNRQMALAMAKQYRTCPPTDVRQDSAQKINFKKHKTIGRSGLGLFQVVDSVDEAIKIIKKVKKEAKYYGKKITKN